MNDWEKVGAGIVVFLIILPVVLLLILVSSGLLAFIKILVMLLMA